MSLHIAILYGSVREVRAGIRVVRFLTGALRRRGHTTTVVDAAEQCLPLLDRMYKEYARGTAPPVLKELAQLYRKVDAFGAEARVEDWRAVVRGKDALVSKLRQAKYVDLLPAYNTLAYFESRARLSEGGVAVNGSALGADKVIITTGASPALPPIPGIEAVPHLTSTTALELDRLPRSLLVIGGGYIGCELGQMFAAPVSR